MPKRTACASCAKPIQHGPTSRPPGEAQCLECRRATVIHGSVKRGYRKGCRCAQCKEAHRVAHLEYRERRKERTGFKQGRRVGASPIRPCSDCGSPTWAKGPTPRCKPCGLAIRRGIHITGPRRLAIYERDGWTCGFCLLPVDATLKGDDPFGPTLDHILPRSLGGSDDESNLRLCHRYCNTVRSNRAALTVDDLAA